MLLINDLGIIIRFRASEIPMSIVTAEEDEEHETINGMEVPIDPDDEPLVTEEDEEEGFEGVQDE